MEKKYAFHAFTMKIDGTEAIFFGTMSQEEHDKINAALIGGLPDDWNCYHLTGQDDSQLPALRALPLVVVFSALAGGDDYANVITELKRIGCLPCSFKL